MKKIIIAFCLFVFDILLLFIARTNLGFADFYGTAIYPFWVNTLGRFSNFFPFSLVGLLLCLILLLSIFGILNIWNKKIYFQNDAPKNGAKNILLFAASLFTLFILTCGINYNRKSFADSYHLRTTSYTVDNLTSVCQLLTDDINTYAAQVSRNESGVMTLDNSIKSDFNNSAISSMKNLGHTYPLLNGYYPNPKPVWPSWILSIQSLSGIYSPFTVEANYNNDMSDYNIPFTACHELSHLRGFMQEEEANFIAYLACSHSDNPNFEYSGALLGWIYCTNELELYDNDAYQQLYASLNASVIEDLKSNSEFWTSYEGTLSDTAEKINDTYLKANQQSDGIKSYDRVVDLIVAYKSRSEH